MASERRTKKRYSDAVSSGMLGIISLVFWTFCVVAYSRLLFHLLAALAGITAAAAYFLYKTAKKRKAALRNEDDRLQQRPEGAIDASQEDSPGQQKRDR